MTHKIVKNAAGVVVAFGPNCDEYQPFIATGNTLEIADELPEVPVVEVPAVDPLSKLQGFLAANPDVAALL